MMQSAFNWTYGALYQNNFCTVYKLMSKGKSFQTEWCLIVVMKLWQFFNVPVGITCFFCCGSSSSQSLRRTGCWRLSWTLWEEGWLIFRSATAALFKPRKFFAVCEGILHWSMFSNQVKPNMILLTPHAPPPTQSWELDRTMIVFFAGNKKISVKIV